MRIPLIAILLVLFFIGLAYALSCCTPAAPPQDAACRLTEQDMLLHYGGGHRMSQAEFGAMTAWLASNYGGGLAGHRAYVVREQDDTLTVVFVEQGCLQLTINPFTQDELDGIYQHHSS